MTYRELLELYSQGKLDEQQKIEIEKELEKQEAFADYLFEHQAPPGMDELFDGTSPFSLDEENAKADDSEEVARQINSSIRKAFIKTGVIAVIIGLILTLFVVFALPHIVSAFYYDPGKVIGTDDNGNEIELLERDMSVYAELYVPEIGPQIRTGSDSYGYGNYSFYVDSTYTVGENKTVNNIYTGNLKRNSVVCYNYEDLSKFESTNYFGNNLSEDEIKSLGAMNSTDHYYAYVAFDEPIPYEQFYADYVDNDEYGTNESWVWCGVKVQAEETTDKYYGYGFYASSGGSFTGYDYDHEAYPLLAWEDDLQINSQKKAATHFNSMLQYLSSGNRFSKIENNLNVVDALWFIDDMREYVAKNGIAVYGLTYVGNKEHIESIAKADHVHRIVVKKVD